MKTGTKKGFTLVELAIVLVVIGILLGLVLKGKSVIDAANSRAEVARLSKIRTAVQSYFTKYDRLPGLKGATAVSSRDVYNALIDDELLSPKDFIADDGKYWLFIGCTTTAATGLNKRWTPATIQSSAGLCAYLSGGLPEAQTSTNNSIVDNKFDGPFICQIESSLDDMSSTNGLGRLVNNVTDGVGKDKFTCNDNDVKTQEGVVYLFKVK